MEPPTGRDTHLALLELKTSALERRFQAFVRDVLVFVALSLLVFPLLLQWLVPTLTTVPVLALSVALAALLVGIPAWRRERREARALAQRRQQIYLSIRPDVFNP
ncbi:MAG: hypothetical protein WDA70_00665 [Lysobacteraceae bacterium]|jgi:Flp pilus assembly protein TadB|uniref:hypothetical protein n=1 Tax=Denitratimonas sp. CY0512 TaxID=3131940 RepID=UPI0030A71F03